MFHLAGGRKIVLSRKEQAPPVEELAGPDEKKSRRRPTLAGPIVRLPLARQRFTSGFGTGPGGTTALWPPGFRGKSFSFSSSCLPGSPWGALRGDFFKGCCVCG